MRFLHRLLGFALGAFALILVLGMTPFHADFP
jgi:hypothetical protein